MLCVEDIGKTWGAAFPFIRVRMNRVDLQPSEEALEQKVVALAPPHRVLS